MGVWRRRFQTLALFTIAASLALLLLMRIGVVRSSGRLGFRLVLVSILASHVFWWSWVRAALAARAGRDQSRRYDFLGRAWTVYAVLMLAPVLLMPLGRRYVTDLLAVPVLTWTVVWHLVVAGFGCGAVLFLLARSAWRLARRGQRPPADDSPLAPSTRDHGPAPAQPALAAPAISRRGFLAGATAAAPMVITAGASFASMFQSGHFLRRQLNIRVPGLPERLRGLTITHLSDFHVGRFFRPEHLPMVVDAANAMKSDLVAITGDIIDHSNEFLPAAVDAFAQIEAPLGRYTVIGNHDLFGNAAWTVRYLSDREPHFLNDQMLSLDVGGERIQIAGLFWSRHETPAGADPGLAARAARALAAARPERFTIALVHHPHAFESLAQRGADLVLAGHTHGGQLMLVPANSGFGFGAGNVMFRYLHGVYAHGNARMYVNSGVGNWFPVRLNAPAEIVQLRLV